MYTHTCVLIFCFAFFLLHYSVVADKTTTQRSYFVAIAGFAVVAWYGLYMHMRGCKTQGYWSWRKLDKETAMAVTAAHHSDIEHIDHVESAGSDKDVKVGQAGTTYATVPYQH